MANILMVTIAPVRLPLHWHASTKLSILIDSSSRPNSVLFSSRKFKFQITLIRVNHWNDLIPDAKKNTWRTYGALQSILCSRLLLRLRSVYASERAVHVHVHEHTGTRGISSLYDSRQQAVVVQYEMKVLPNPGLGGGVGWNFYHNCTHSLSRITHRL